MPRRLLVLALTAGGAACAGSMDPDPWAAGRRQMALNAERLETVMVSRPTLVHAGDTLELIVTLHNPTATTVDMGMGGCGPSLLFEVTPPSGPRLHPIPLDLPPNAAWTCDRRDIHDIEPGETDSLTIRWPAPAAAGRYQVWAGVRMPASPGLQRITPIDEFEVR